MSAGSLRRSSSETRSNGVVFTASSGMVEPARRARGAGSPSAASRPARDGPSCFALRSSSSSRRFSGVSVARRSERSLIFDSMGVCLALEASARDLSRPRLGGAQPLAQDGLHVLFRDAFKFFEQPRHLFLVVPPGLFCPARLGE